MSMVRERSEGKGRGRNPKARFSKRSPKKDSESNESYEDYLKNRKSPSRESSRYSRNKPKLEMTKVTCSSCGNECEVPFKPTSKKPVYCSNCFTKKDKVSSDRDMDVINEKLNKIMKALDIE
jgi:CxxC-x17-CxxC domain-containing protein